MKNSLLYYFLFYLTFSYSCLFAQNNSDYTVYAIKPFIDFAFPLSDPIGLTGIDTIRIFTATNEYESFSFAVRAKKDLQKITIRIDTLRGERTGGFLLPERFDRRMVKYWYQEGLGWTGNFLVPEILMKNPDLVTVDYKTQKNTLNFSGYYPTDSKDLLPVDISANTNFHFWVIGKIDSTVIPDIYYGFCIVSGLNTIESRIPIVWEVLPIHLDPPNKAYGIYHPIKMSSRGGPGHQVTSKQYRAMLRDMIEHGITRPTMYEYVGDAYGQLWFDDVDWVRHEEGIMNDSLILLGVDLPTVPEKGEVDQETLLDVKRKASQAKQFFDSKGVKGVYLYGYDEYYGDMLKKAVPVYQAIIDGGMRVSVACYTGYFPIAGTVIDLPVVSMGDMVVPADVELVHQRGRDVWFYALPQTHWNVISPYAMRSNYGFWLYQSPAQGMAPWDYMSWANNPWDDFDSGTLYWSDMLIAYPTWDEPIPTIIWEAIREGVDDARYMTTMQNLITRAKMMGITSNAISEAEQLLKNFTIPFVDWSKQPQLLITSQYIGTLLQNKPDLNLTRWAFAWRILKIQEDIATGIDDNNNSSTASIPEHYRLDQNFPNPFNAETSIKYYVSKESFIDLTIYNILGQKIITLIAERQRAGEYRILWNGKNNSGEMVASGIYLYRLQAGDIQKTKKMLYLR